MSAALRLPALALGGLLALAAVGASGPARAQEVVSMRRFSDVVAVRRAPGAREQVLYHFAPTAELVQGGHLEQGSGGLSEIYLSGGARIALRASGHAVLDTLSPEGDVLRFPVLTMLEVRGGSRPLELRFPGGVRCQMSETALLVEALPGRLRLRNQGGLPVTVLGPEPAQPATLGPGEEIGFPLFETPVVENLSTLRWGDVSVRYAPGVQLREDGERLLVTREAEGELQAEAPVSVGGVATRPGEGRLVIRNPRAQAPAPAPAPAPEPAPEPAPAPAAVPTPAPQTPDDTTPGEPAPSEERQR